MASALIGLGANLGNRAATLDAALAQLARHAEINVIHRSRAEEFPSIGGPAGQPAYLNAAARLETTLPPHDLWRSLAEVETQLGRTRDVRWGARTIDLDLLLYDDQVVQSTTLTLPHPRMAVRRFVLQPAAQIAADMVHPMIGWTIGRLLAHLDNHPRYVALAGPIGVGKTQLAAEMVAVLQERMGIAGRTLQEPIDDAMLDRFYGDPAGRAPEMELEFLQLRAPLMTKLAADAGPGWIVSDFWFGQALAYGELWLKPEQCAAQRRQYQALAANVVPPKLLILLDAPPDELRRRIARRGRPYEQSLSEELLDQLRRNIHHAAATAHRGPMLQLSAENQDTVVNEVAAAIAGMQ